MTVNELFKVWLHNKNPYAIINVWDRGIGDYIFKTNPPIPNQNAEEIGKMEVKCFYSSDEENGKCPVLTVNVGEYN